MPALLKYTLILINILCLSACWHFEERNHSSDSGLLPAVNNSLSTESPTGIWILNIDASIEAKYYQRNSFTIAYTKKSSHKIREFITISKAENGVYSIKECSIETSPSIMPNSRFNNNVGLTLTDKALTHSLMIESETVELLQNIIKIPFSSEVNLILDNNLSLKGGATHMYKSRSLPFNDPLLPPSISFDEIRTLNITGVKVSDETNFSQASELTTSFTIDGIPFLDTEATAIKCIRIENRNYTTNRINPDASQEMHHSSQTLTLAEFNSTNGIYMQTDKPNSPEKTVLWVDVDNTLFVNPILPITFPYCTDTDDNCEKIIKVISNLNSSTPNSIGNTIIATKSNSEDIEIKVSVMVN